MNTTTITDTMREALIQITARNSDGTDIPSQTLDALERRGLLAQVRENDLRHWEATAAGREIMGQEFRDRREALPGLNGKATMTRDDLAELLGVTDTAIYLWESGRRPIQPMTWRALEWAELRAWMRRELHDQVVAALGRFTEATEGAIAATGVANAILASAGIEPEGSDG